MRRFLFAALLIPSAALAQEPPVPIAELPDIAVTATRVPTLIQSIPAGVTVIDRATVDSRGYTTLAEALSAVPGLRVVQSGGQGGNASVFIRGTDSDQVLVLRDGVPINDPSDPNDSYNFGVDTLEDIERIEVVRGPMSSLYGSGAIGGVINLISRAGSGAPHGSVTAAGGLPLQDLFGATLSGKSGQFDYNLDAENQSQEGSDTTPKRESVYNGARNGYRSNLGSLELGYTPIDGTRLSVLVRGSESVFGLDELGFPAYDAHDYTGRSNNAFGRLGATTSLFGGIWESGLFLSRNIYDRDYNEALEAADPNQGFGDSRYHGVTDDLQWNNTVHLPDYRWSRGTSLLFGYEHIAESSQLPGKHVVRRVCLQLERGCERLQRRGPCWVADHAAATADGNRRPALRGRALRRRRVHLSAWRRAGRAGSVRPDKSLVWHGIPCPVAVRPVRRGQHRLCRQPEPEAGAQPRLGIRRGIRRARVRAAERDRRGRDVFQ